MATLAAAAARQTANSLRLSSARTAGQASNLIHGRGLAGPADYSGSPKNFWRTKWQKYVYVSLAGLVELNIFSHYLFFTGGKVKKEEKLVEASH